MQVSRPINKADMEFYQSAIVRKMAFILSGYNETEWDALSHRTKNKWLDRAVESSCDLINDRNVAVQLPMLAKNIIHRI